MAWTRFALALMAVLVLKCIQTSTAEDSHSTTAEPCRSSEFTCDNGECVHTLDECDGHDDCGDNSDEHCESPVNVGLIVGLTSGLFSVVLLISIAIFTICLIRYVIRQAVRGVLENPTSGVRTLTTGGGTTVSVKGTRYFIPWPVKYPHQLYFNTLGSSPVSSTHAQTKLISLVRTGTITHYTVETSDGHRKSFAIPWPPECPPHLLKYQQLAPSSIKATLPSYYDIKLEDMYGDDPFLDRSGRRSVSWSDTARGTEYTVARETEMTRFFIPWPIECPAELIKYLNQDNDNSKGSSTGMHVPTIPSAAQATPKQQLSQVLAPHGPHAQNKAIKCLGCFL